MVVCPHPSMERRWARAAGRPATGTSDSASRGALAPTWAPNCSRREALTVVSQYWFWGQPPTFGGLKRSWAMRRAAAANDGGARRAPARGGAGSAPTVGPAFSPKARAAPDHVLHRLLDQSGAGRRPGERRMQEDGPQQVGDVQILAVAGDQLADNGVGRD